MMISNKTEETISFPSFYFFNKEEKATKIVDGNVVNRIIAFVLENDPLTNWLAIRGVSKQFYNHYKCEQILRLIFIHAQQTDQIPQQLFIRAIEINSLYCVQQLLSLTVVTKSGDSFPFIREVNSDEANKALRTICAKGYKEIVQCLIKDQRIDFSTTCFRGIRLIEFDEAVVDLLESPCLSAVRGNQLEIIQMLWESGILQEIKNLEIAFCEACRLGHEQIVQFFLMNSDLNQWEECIKFSMYHILEYEHLEVLKTLVKDKRLCLNKWNLSILRLACCKGDVELVKNVLEDKELGELNTLRIAHSSLYSAIENGYVDIVRALLADKRINPGDSNQHALNLAGQRGQTQIVKELLKDKRVSILPLLIDIKEGVLVCLIMSISLHVFMCFKLITDTSLSFIKFTNKPLITSQDFLILNGLILVLTTVALVCFIFYRIFSHLWLFTSVGANLAYYQFKRMVFHPKSKNQIEQKKV